MGRGVEGGREGGREGRFTLAQQQNYYHRVDEVFTNPNYFKCTAFSALGIIVV